jgi:uncharacterized protein (TIGR00251 family)
VAPGVTARVTVHLIPKGGRSSIDGWDGQVLRARVAAAAVDGKANDALVKLLAKALHIAPSRVEIVAGGSSRTKIVEIEGMDLAAVRTATS